MTDSDPYVFLDLYDIANNLYVFTHIKPIIKDRDREALEFKFCFAITIVICFLLVFTLIKFLVILIYFFIVQSLLNLSRFIVSLSRTKCRLNLCLALKSGVSFISSNLKKLYSYNYYSYDNVIIGAIFILFYHGYLISTSLFSYYVYSNALVEKELDFKILHFITFEFNIIIEVLCISFYHIRGLAKQFVVSLGTIIVLNVFIVFAVLFKNVLINEIGVFEKDEPKRVANLLFFFFLGTLHLSTFVGLMKYDVNKEALRVLLTEKESFYGNRLMSVTNIENNKIEDISKKYKIKGFYYSRDKHNVFKRKDRFQKKLYLAIFFSVLFAVSLFEFIYQLYMLSSAPNVQEAKWIEVTKKFVSMIHVVAVILLSWCTFMKLEIKTITLY